MKLLREYVNGFELPRLKEANIRGRERYVQRLAVETTLTSKMKGLAVSLSGEFFILIRNRL